MKRTHFTSTPNDELAMGIQTLQQRLVQNYLAGLHDSNPRIRKKAVRGLGYIGRPAVEAIPALKALCNDESPYIRDVVRWALARIDP